MPERVGPALLRWINPPEVRPLFYAASVTTPGNVNEFVVLSQAAQAKFAGPVALAGIGGIQELPAQLANREATVRQTEQFRSAYEPLGAAFASVALADLIAPQWWVDSAYVDELVSMVPAVGNDNALFDFCFATGRLEPPMMLGMNGAVIVSGRRALGTISPLRVEAATPDQVTFAFDALPRPNWLWLNVIPQTNQILILNGTHHLLALMRAGRDRAFCLIRNGIIEQVLNPQDPGLFRPQQLTAARPPLLRDYLDPNITDNVGVRAVNQFMRFGVQNPPEIGFVPQGE